MEITIEINILVDHTIIENMKEEEIMTGHMLIRARGITIIRIIKDTQGMEIRTIINKEEIKINKSM